MKEWSEEQKRFISKYGVDLLYSWNLLDDIQKKEYQEIENYYSIFTNLLNEHYEDLKVYAIMYRNVPLYACDKDPISVLFFASKNEEIIGFKKKLQNSQSDKAKIALLFYDNEALFPKFIRKHTGINIGAVQPKIQVIYSSLLKDFHAENYDHIFSVCDLDEIECRKILSLKSDIQSYYTSVYNDCSENNTIYHFENIKDFILEYFIPNILQDDDSLRYKRILRYIKMNYRTNCEIAIESLKNKYLKYTEKLNIYEKEKLELISKTHLNLLELGCGTYNLDPVINKYWIKVSYELDRETERIDRLKSELLQALVYQIEELQITHFIYCHFEDIERYVTTSCERLYNILWLKKPMYIRSLEFETTSARSICDLFDSLTKRRGDSKFILYRGRSKYTGNKIFMFRRRDLIKQWFEIIDKEYKEAQRIKEEQQRIKEERLKREEEIRKEKFRYNKKNRHPRDLRISFDEDTHLYKVNGITLQSVTNFIDGCFPKFDAEFFAKKKAAHMGITTQEVLDMWEQKGKESRELGTELHKKIENYYQGVASTEDDTFKLFLMFAEKVQLRPYRTEWAVYDIKHNIAGTIDFVDYQNGEYIIYDWKRSDKIIANGMPIKISKYNERGNNPLEHLENTPYYHYALQLSIYKFILENNYNIKISDLRLGIFHPSYSKPYVLRMPYLEKEINDLFNLRSEILF